MKTITLLVAFCFSAITLAAQNKTAPATQPDTLKKMQMVEASCGQCQFGLAGKGCSLAVRINGKAYFVDGSKIDDHGDAHAADGFCEAIRKAEVQGEVVNNRFQASYFKLVKADKKKKKGTGSGS
jgi:Family of unknown function (DUF6370)